MGCLDGKIDHEGISRQSKKFVSPTRSSAMQRSGWSILPCTRIRLDHSPDGNLIRKGIRAVGNG